MIGQFSKTEQVLVGDLNANERFSKGGVFRAPMLLARQRGRSHSHGGTGDSSPQRNSRPACGARPDQQAACRPLSRPAICRRPIIGRSAWIDLLRGLAQAGAGKLDEADNLLGRSLVIDGQFDHPLTGVALLEQGRIAAIRGDTRRATQLFAEAGYSAFYFEDFDVLTESALNGWLNHLASGAAGVYPPLDPIATWAQTNRLHHVATKLRLAQAESLLWLNQMAAAASIIDDVGRRIGEMRTGLPGVHLLYAAGSHCKSCKAVSIGRRSFDARSGSASRRLAAQLSNRTLRTTCTTSRAASARVALELYNGLLADPSPADWLRNPLDAMAVVQTGHDAAFDRWFLAALERKEPPLALEVAERAKRRRFLATQPLGGRLLALRAILESPEADLSRDGLAQRQQLLGSFPGIPQIGRRGPATLSPTCKAAPCWPQTAADAKPLNALYDQWDRNATDRQHILAQLAVRRLPSSLEFPPMRYGARAAKIAGRRRSARRVSRRWRERVWFRGHKGRRSTSGNCRTSRRLRTASEISSARSATTARIANSPLPS